MKIYNRKKEQYEPNNKEIAFKHVKQGQIFYRDGIYRIKIDGKKYFKVDMNRDPAVESINAFKIGIRSNEDRNYIGSSSVFSPDTIVTVFPNAAIYLEG